MKISTHGDYLIKLTKFGLVNIFLVREPDGFTVVDTGMSGSAGAIQEAAQEQGLPIKRIVLTHAHADHAGSLDALAKAVPQAEVLFTQRTAQFLAGERELLASEPQAELKGSFIESSTKATAIINPGDLIGSLRVIAAPGHSPDQVAFLDERDQTLIAGDAFQTLRSMVVSGVVQWFFPFPGMATWHKPTAVITARTLTELQPSRLAVGHGKVVENPGQQMGEAVLTAEKKYGSPEPVTQ